jgi:hypothetical protein
MRKIFFLFLTLLCLILSGTLAFNNYPELVWGLPFLPGSAFFLLACMQSPKSKAPQKESSWESSPAIEVQSSIFRILVGCGAGAFMLVLSVLCLILWYFGFFHWFWKNLPPILLALLFSCGIIGGALSNNWRYKEPRP